MPEIVDDLTHYMEAVSRLKSENKRLQGDVVALSNEGAGLRGVLQEIARHQVASAESSASPCDWHCTRMLTDLAKSALEGGNS